MFWDIVQQPAGGPKNSTVVLWPTSFSLLSYYILDSPFFNQTFTIMNFPLQLDRYVIIIFVGPENKECLKIFFKIWYKVKSQPHEKNFRITHSKGEIYD